MLVEGADGPSGHAPDKIDLPELGEVRVCRPDDLDQVSPVVHMRDQRNHLHALDHGPSFLKVEKVTALPLGGRLSPRADLATPVILPKLAEARLEFRCTDLEV